MRLLSFSRASPLHHLSLPMHGGWVLCSLLMYQSDKWLRLGNTGKCMYVWKVETKKRLLTHPKGANTKKRASCAGPHACINSEGETTDAPADARRGSRKSSAGSWMGCTTRSDQVIARVGHGSCLCAGVDGERGARAIFCCCLFLLVEKSGAQTSSVVSEMTLSLDTQKKRSRYRRRAHWRHTVTKGRGRAQQMRG